MLRVYRPQSRIAQLRPIFTCSDTYIRSRKQPIRTSLIGCAPLTLHPPQTRPVSRWVKAIATRPKWILKIFGKFPKFMVTYGQSVIGSPFSNLCAFLLVQQMTVAVPLFTLWFLFNQFDYMPPGIPDWVFGAGEDFLRKLGDQRQWSWIQHADQGSKVLLHGAAAYGVVKATFPFRVLFSLWAMPWVARKVVKPTCGFLGRITGISKADVEPEKASQDSTADTQERKQSTIDQVFKGKDDAAAAEKPMAQPTAEPPKSTQSSIKELFVGKDNKSAASSELKASERPQETPKAEQTPKSTQTTIKELFTGKDKEKL